MKPHALFALVAASCIALSLDACTHGDEPYLEAWEDGSYEARPVTSYDFAGHRDGGTTTAVATFTMDGGDRLVVELEINYDPTPALGGGRWHLSGSKPASGDVHAESVKFLGGQGQGPSLGGRFRLDEKGSPRFRVVLPLRPVERTPWSAQ